MTVTVDQLLEMEQKQLDDLFSAHEAGPIPNGEGEGTAIIDPGAARSRMLARIINRFAWHGKVFDAEHGTLRNRILAPGIEAIVAQVYKGPSLLDGRECIVLDYSKTSLIAGWVRDEIREIAPKLYLGKVYAHEKRLIDFALQF
jgi:hypothetical protein